MICYRDMTFCMDAPYCKNRDTCHKYFSPEEKKRAESWMKDPPVAFSNYADTCKSFEYDDGKEYA